jgi:murein DD-endopeptidase MepM/ murein hydrolase activator NlpD
VGKKSKETVPMMSHDRLFSRSGGARQGRPQTFFFSGGVVFLSVLALFLLSGARTASGAVRLEAPEVVFPGQPFVVTLIADEPVEKVTVQWNGEAIDLPVEVRQTGAGEARYAAALLGVGLSQKPGRVPLRVDAVVSGAAHSSRRELKVRDKEYPVQRLTVKKRYVDVAKADLDRHEKERARVKQALALRTGMRFWDLPLHRPVPGGVSSVFGLRRFFNDQPRKPHSGIDLRGAQGSPIQACAEGVVVLAENHFFAGNSVYIDHGEGVVSMYFHMSRLDVRAGERVKKGQVIGAVGSTGRVTGPHLHFGLSLQGVFVDPMPLFE